MKRGVRLKRSVKSHVRSTESNVRVVVEGCREGRSKGLPGGLTRGDEVRGNWSTVTCLV